MTKKLYVLQHVASEPLGFWEEELKRWHAHYEYVRLWEGAPLPEPENTFAVIVLGGPMNVSDTGMFPFLSREVIYLNALLQQRTPILGICLGAQLLAVCLGAKVTPGPKPEVGYQTVTLTPEGAQDRLLSGFPMELPVFQWHAQGFELPAQAERLAHNPAYPCQAFRCEKAWGFQFHLEVTPELVDEWVVKHPEEVRLAGLNRTRIAGQAASQGQLVTLYGRQVIRRFWDSLAEN